MAVPEDVPVEDRLNIQRRGKLRDSWWLLGWVILFWGLALQSYSKLPLDTLNSVVAAGQSRSALLLTAHPDDEAMFFSPALMALVRDGWTVHGLCLSEGNESGLGNVRRQELFESYSILGVNPHNIVVLDDPRFQDGMQNHWNTTEIATVLSKHMEQLPISLIITFDQQGITRHPNHTPLPTALLSMTLPQTTQIGLLHSPSVYSKFTGPLLAIYHVNKHFFNVLLDHLPIPSPIRRSLAVSGNSIVVVSSLGGWITGWRAMLKHRSQLVWFRWLYLMFSRLMWFNQLDLVEHAV